ncbi:hypothetical protein SNEBB_005376 [Seison nebaliae]|nr:hypothetical protein SNEBB_005376 [Seison nebaliae]
MNNVFIECMHGEHVTEDAHVLQQINSQTSFMRDAFIKLLNDQVVRYEQIFQLFNEQSPNMSLFHSIPPDLHFVKCDKKLVNFVEVTIEPEDNENLFKSFKQDKPDLILKNILRQTNRSAFHPIRSNFWGRLLRPTLPIERSNSKSFSDELNNSENGQIIMSRSQNTFIGNLHYLRKSSNSLNDSIRYLRKMNETLFVSPFMKRLIICFLHYMDVQMTCKLLQLLIQSKPLSKKSNVIDNHGVKVMKDNQLNEFYIMTTRKSWVATTNVMSKLYHKHFKFNYRKSHKFHEFNWHIWIFDCLSFEFIVNIIDMYLREGFKIILRFTLALFDRFVKSRTALPIEEFIQNDIATWDNFNQLKQEAFSIHRFSREEFIRMLTNEQKLLCTLNFDEEPSEMIIDVNLKIPDCMLNANELRRIWEYIPSRNQVRTPYIAFSMAEHGTSLQTLHKLVDELSSNILLIKTTDEQVIGAYSSVEWTCAKRSELPYFGTGETFVFTLRPKTNFHEWSEDNNYFIRFDQGEQSIVFGGNVSGNGEAIMIDQDMRNGKSSPSATFASERLTTNETFSIRQLEVIGFSD